MQHSFSALNVQLNQQIPGLCATIHYKHHKTTIASYVNCNPRQHNHQNSYDPFQCMIQLILSCRRTSHTRSFPIKIPPLAKIVGVPRALHVPSVSLFLTYSLQPLYISYIKYSTPSWVANSPIWAKQLVTEKGKINSDITTQCRWRSQVALYAEQCQS